MTTYIEPAAWGSWGEPAALLPEVYVSAIIRVGACPVLLPPGPLGLTDRALSAVDGLVITGGADVDPSRYGAEPGPKTSRPRTERDAWELALCRAALDEDLPLLAICRGHQVLNVCLGGTLHQHLPDVVGHDEHAPAPGQMGSTSVSLVPGSTFAGILGPTSVVPCHHHQAIDRLGEGLGVAGFAADGTIEAVEVMGRRFALGVQWHPEDKPSDDRIFTAFAGAAAATRVGQS
ncbi:MAG TPA: gamma-glutamyl-gamma-aminobutyrate hydrolase family protein [Acidimicrobiales bacterium]